MGRSRSATPRGPLSLRLSLRVDSICTRLESDGAEPLVRPDPVAVGRHVDALCERFEVAWRGGEDPRIEDYLPPRDDAAWSRALPELVALERELRRRMANQRLLRNTVAAFLAAPTSWVTSWGARL